MKNDFTTDTTKHFCSSGGCEIDGNTGDVRIFRQVQASRRIIALCHVFLYCSCQLVWC
jgi:hypothetical protein